MTSLSTATQNFKLYSRERLIEELAQAEAEIAYCQDKNRDNTIPPQFVERKKFNLVQFIRWAIKEVTI